MISVIFETLMRVLPNLTFSSGVRAPIFISLYWTANLAFLVLVARCCIINLCWSFILQIRIQKGEKQLKRIQNHLSQDLDFALSSLRLRSNNNKRPVPAHGAYLRAWHRKHKSGHCIWFIYIDGYPPPSKLVSNFIILRYRVLIAGWRHALRSE